MVPTGAQTGPAPRYAYRLELARKHFPREGHLLDLGCGDGSWARWITDELPGLDAHGVDVLDGCTSDIAFEVYDGRRLPYGDWHFDVVLVLSVLHHARDPEGLVSEISRVSRSGAKVLVVEDIASSRVQTFLTKVEDLYANRMRNFWRALTGTHRWAMTGVPMTYEYRSYPDWVSIFGVRRLALVEMMSIPHFMIEHGVFVFEKQ